MTYRRRIQVEFNHCDPAGIVFYPRYFEMTNSVVENFFAEVVGRSFAAMHRGAANGVPTVHLEADFLAPSRLGDLLDFTLAVEAVGRTSLKIRIEAQGDGDLRLRARLTLVWIDTMRAAPWPDEMRARLAACQETAP